MKFKKIQQFKRPKVSYTYFLPKHAVVLEYLTKYCENLRIRKVDILDEALTKLFATEKKYSKEINSKRFKDFKKFSKNSIDKE